MSSENFITVDFSGVQPTVIACLDKAASMHCPIIVRSSDGTRQWQVGTDRSYLFGQIWHKASVSKSILFFDLFSDVWTGYFCFSMHINETGVLKVKTHENERARLQEHIRLYDAKGELLTLDSHLEAFHKAFGSYRFYNFEVGRRAKLLPYDSARTFLAFFLKSLPFELWDDATIGDFNCKVLALGKPVGLILFRWEPDILSYRVIFDGGNEVKASNSSSESAGSGGVSSVTVSSISAASSLGEKPVPVSDKKDIPMTTSSTTIASNLFSDFSKAAIEGAQIGLAANVADQITTEVINLLGYQGQVKVLYAYFAPSRYLLPIVVCYTMAFLTHVTNVPKGAEIRAWLLLAAKGQAAFAANAAMPNLHRLFTMLAGLAAQNPIGDNAVQSSEQKPA